MDALGVVEPEIVGELVEEFLGLADRILMHLDELFGEIDCLPEPMPAGP